MTSSGELADFCAAEHRRVVAILALLVGDRAVAEELAQDALLKLCTRWPSVRRMDNPAAWLTRVAVNLGNSDLRRRGAERRAVARHGARPEHEGGRADTADILAVRQAVADLPKRQRAAIVYRYYADFSVNETADAMHCKPGTVRALTWQALDRLRRTEGIGPTLVVETDVVGNWEAQHA